MRARSRASRVHLALRRATVVVAILGLVAAGCVEGLPRNLQRAEGRAAEVVTGSLAEVEASGSSFEVFAHRERRWDCELPPSTKSGHHGASVRSADAAQLFEMVHDHWLEEYGDRLEETAAGPTGYAYELDGGLVNLSIVLDGEDVVRIDTSTGCYYVPDLGI